MRQRTIEADFLVCGFDPDDEAQIIVLETGQTRRATNYGHWAIGSGASLAVHSLVTHQHGRGTRPYGLAVYLVAAAKFAAEADKGVGPATSIYVFDCNAKFLAVPRRLLDELRRLWESVPRDEIPSGVSKAVHDVLKLDDC
jgi:hypothetical protein